MKKILQPFSLAAAERDIARGKGRVVTLENAVHGAASEAKARIGSQISALKADLSAAMAKLRRNIDQTVG